MGNSAIIKDKVDISQFSKGRLLNMYRTAIGRCMHVEALLYFYQPDEEYFKKAPENIVELLKENAMVIMKEREKKEEKENGKG